MRLPDKFIIVRPGGRLVSRRLYTRTYTVARDFYEATGLLEGEKVALRLIEKEGLWILHSWLTDPSYTGNYEAFPQITQGELEKQYRDLYNEQWWWIEVKGGSPIGFLSNRLLDSHQEIRFLLAPDEKGKGYATEAVRIIVDHLFSNFDIARIQAETHPGNVATQRVLEKNGFILEGVLRKKVFSRGSWRDYVLYSLIRDEWTPPLRVR